jgi:hypothetical protein
MKEGKKETIRLLHFFYSFIPALKNKVRVFKAGRIIRILHLLVCGLTFLNLNPISTNGPFCLFWE